jgi:hypothetical protein
MMNKGKKNTQNLDRRELFRPAADGSVPAGLSLAGCEGELAGGGAAAKKRPSASTWLKTKNTKKP